MAPLYGALDMASPAKQPIAPAPAGRRKVVLATSIAETSLTIEGVRVVIDCGLARVPRYEPDVGVTRLDTVRVSRAAADQRPAAPAAPRPASATASGTSCRRPASRLRGAGDAPGRSRALVLDCAEWGALDPRTLAWLDPPTESRLAAARDELLALGALDAEGRITEAGGGCARCRCRRGSRAWCSRRPSSGRSATLPISPR